MDNNTHEIAKLKASYTNKELRIFFRIEEQNKHLTYRDVIDLYEKCLRKKDIFGLMLLNNNYNLEEIMKFDNEIGVERCIFSNYSIKHYCNAMRRKYQHKKNNTKMYLGGVYYRNLCRTDKKGNILFNSKRLIYKMTSNEIEKSLFCIGETLDKKMTLIEQFEYLYKHPKRNEVILFYLSTYIYPRFPSEELEELKKGNYLIE